MANPTHRICLWSGPRNVSTALMYAFAQRDDTVVVDEPLYAHYLARTPARAYHPDAEEVIRTMDADGERVVREVILGEHPRPVAFFKNMTHHLVELDLGFLARTTNVLLTRDPVEMLPSYVKQVADPTPRDVGYEAQVDLLEHLRSIGQEPPVLDAREILLDPRKVLGKLCDRLEIPFQPAMLSWDAGPRPEDGVWAKHWYGSVHRSTGFRPYHPPTEPFPEDLKPLLEACRPYYERLSEVAIRA